MDLKKKKTKKNPLSAHCDRASACNVGQMALRSSRYGPLYFSFETGIVKTEILQKQNIRLTLHH